MTNLSALINEDTKINADNSPVLCHKFVGSIPITYKTKLSFLKNSYILKSTINLINTEVKSIHNNLQEFLTEFLTISEAEKYTSKDRYDSFMDVALTQSILDSRIASYAKTEDIESMKAAVIQKADALAAEMSDFAAAAMVGINQGSAVLEGETEAGEGKE